MLMRNMILNNPAALKRFCRDYNVPVSTYHPDYFEQQLETISLYRPQVIDQFTQFVTEVTQHKDVDEYFEYYNQVKDAAITFIQNHTAFKDFCDIKFDSGSRLKKELYSPENHQRSFISIDISKANYSILNFYCPEIFNGLSWEDFLKQFGASNYIANSKYIRQVIFGACNPKKQIQAQAMLVNFVAMVMEEEDFTLYSVATDEVILSVSPGDVVSINEIKSILQNHFPKLHECLKVEAFTLLANKQGYEKFIFASSVSSKSCKPEFKCIDSDLMCQVIKYYYHKEITESDIVFDYKGKLAKFTEPIENPFNI